MIEFKVVEGNDELFAQRKHSQWAELVNALREGKTVMLPPEMDTRTNRSGIHAQALKAGFKVMIRANGDGLYMKAKEEGK